MLEGFHQKTVDDLLAAIGEGALGAAPGGRGAAPRRAAGRARRARRRRQGRAAAPAAAGAAAATGWETLVAGLLPGMAVSFAGCCHPIPGDPIVGVVRTGRGVAIHRSDCRDPRPQGRRRRPLARSGLEPELPTDAKAIARLQVMTTNQPGSLGSLSTVIGKQGGNITDLRFGAKSADLYEIMLDIEVEDRDHLDRIVARACAPLRSSPRSSGPRDERRRSSAWRTCPALRDGPGPL